MGSKLKDAADWQIRSKPGSVDQQSEDTFPASDAPSFSSSVVGAPCDRRTDARPVVVKATRKKAKSGNAKAPRAY